MRAYDENKLTNIVLLEETDTFLSHKITYFFA